MSNAVPEVIPCRLCTEPVPRNAAVCPVCGARDPWIPEEPTINPWALRVLTWVGAVVLVGLLLFVAGVLMFAPVEDEHDHRPPANSAVRHDSR